MPPANLQRPAYQLSQLTDSHAIVFGAHVHEVDGKLVESQSPSYGTFDIVISADEVKRSARTVAQASVFLQSRQSTTIALISAWRSGCLVSTMYNMLTEKYPQLPVWIDRGVRVIVKLASIPPPSLVPSCLHMAGIRGDARGGVSDEGVVRCARWHPNTGRLALLLRNDSVRVYRVTGARAGGAAVECRKHRLQRNVRDLAWRPYWAGIMALACESCIVVACVDSATAGATTGSATNGSLSTPATQVLAAAGHAPVVSVQWCPLGDLLVSLCARATCALVWHVAAEQHVALTRVACDGRSLVSWSPCGARVLATCIDSTFCVWKCEDWTCHRERIPSAITCGALYSQVTCCCWSADGESLLLTFSSTPGVYYTSFRSALVSQQMCSISLVIDTTCVQIDSSLGPLSVGGLVGCMSWEPRGSHVAVSFVECCVVLLLRASCAGLSLPPLLTACGVICGEVSERVMGLEYQREGLPSSVSTNLTICWSSGRVQHVPTHTADVVCLSAAVDPAALSLNSVHDSLNLGVACSPVVWLYVAAASVVDYEEKLSQCLGQSSGFKLPASLSRDGI